MLNRIEELWYKLQPRGINIKIRPQMEASSLRQLQLKVQQFEPILFLWLPSNLGDCCPLSPLRYKISQKCIKEPKKKSHVGEQSTYLLPRSPSLFLFVPPHFPRFITVIGAISPRPLATALAAVLMFPQQKRKLIISVLDGWMMLLCVKHMEFQSPEPWRCRRTGSLNLLQQMD